MFSFEGSRHERVVGVLSAYIIGFTTAFIAFGVSEMSPTVKFVEVPTQASTAAVINAVAEPEATVPAALAVGVTEEGLEVVRDGVPTLVSAYVGDGGEDGMHHSIYEYILSPEQDALYFCEVPTASAEACKPFVMDLMTDIVYPLTAAGERIALPLGVAHDLTWLDGSVIRIGEVMVDPQLR